MSNSWIGTIKLTNEEAVYGSGGEKLLNYLRCDRSKLDANRYPRLASRLKHQPTEPLDPILASTYTQTITQCLEYTEQTEFYNHLDQSQPNWEERYGDYSLDHPNQYISTIGGGDTLHAVVLPVEELFTPPLNRALLDTYAQNAPTTSLFTMRCLTSSGSEVYKLEYTVSSARVAELVTYIGGVSQGVKVSKSFNIYNILHLTDSGMYGIIPDSGLLEWSDTVDLSEVTAVEVSGETSGGTTYWTGTYVRSIARTDRLPGMSAPAGSPNPYKIIADL